ncbi:MAG TPA: hypothetical protein EYQ18_09600 [Candidatus Handelsmanbacteria bacterium]|nr:hypothetical protein [Candidatus Handelsmanbacteria bacterium]
MAADGERPCAKCWYKSIIEPELQGLALRYALSQPIAAALPLGAEGFFERAIDIAQHFAPVTETKVEVLRPQAGAPRFFARQRWGLPGIRSSVLCTLAHHCDELSERECGKGQDLKAGQGFQQSSVTAGQASQAGGHLLWSAMQRRDDGRRPDVEAVVRV